MTVREAQVAGHRTVLVAHPSADLYGSDRVLLESISGLAEAGWRVVVTVPADGPLVPLLESRGATVELCPSPVLRKSALRPRGFARLVADSVRGLLRGNALISRHRPDALYVNTVTVPLWVLIARSRRVPVLCHVHEAEGSASVLVKRVLAAPLLLATAVVANSSYSVGVLGSAFPRLGRRTEVILNGVPSPAEVVPPREVLDPPIRLLYLGRLSPRKGVDVAVEAARLLTVAGVPVSLDILGSVFPGYEWYLEQLQEQIRTAALGTAVQLLGFEPDVWGRVAHADLVLVPSRVDEPFGNTAVEAVLAARPVVASATSGLLEATAGYACARSVTPGDAQSIADAVREIVDTWAAVRAAAMTDAVTAEARHSLAVYRARVVAAVDHVAGARVRRDSGTMSERVRELGGATHVDRSDMSGTTGPVVPPEVSELSTVIAVLTYQRPGDLAEILPALVAQAESAPTRAHVLVVDNDPGASAAPMAQAAGPLVRYVHEPIPGIAAARNRALTESVDCDLLVFIDDDERPAPQWLTHLLGTYSATRPAAVVGPVVSEFDGSPTAWVAAGRFFDRRRLPTGTSVTVAATNNLLLDLRQIEAAGLRFDERFGLSGGSDTLFTRALVRRGGRMVWCDEAVVVDVVPVARISRDWVVRRAFRSGNSWSRTSLELATTAPQAWRERAVLTTRGSGRFVAGAGQALVGYVTRQLSWQARGVRTAARGAGMTAGAWGHVYSEYRR